MSEMVKLDILSDGSVSLDRTRITTNKMWGMQEVVKTVTVSKKAIVEALDIEQEIRNKAIDEFVKEIESEYDNDGCPNVADYLDYKISIRDLIKIAELLKGGAV